MLTVIIDNAVRGSTIRSRFMTTVEAVAWVKSMVSEPELTYVKKGYAEYQARNDSNEVAKIKIEVTDSTVHDVFRVVEALK
jgi:hypothetical protein